mgnify:CR=1 FL=1
MEIMLVIVILALCGLLAWKERESRLERSKLINAIISKSAQDMTNLELADKTKIETNIPQIRPDLVPESELNDETFTKMMKEGKLNV